ncbi:MAG: glycosyltransferase [bacterium]
MTRAGGPLRLLQVNTTPGWRGGEGQTYFLCRGLVERGHDVLLAAAPKDELFRRASQAGVAARGVRIRGDGDVFGIAALGAIVAGFRPHLIHLHTSRAHAAGWTLSFAFPRIPLVVSRRVDFAPARDALTRSKYMSRVARYIAVSDRVAEVLAESGVDRRRIRRVYSGVPPRARTSTSARDALRASLGLAPDSIAIGTVGALAEHKDPMTLLAAFARVRSRHARARLLFFGDGELREGLLREAARTGLADSVILAGFRDDPLDCISALDIFVAPSYLEGLNTSLLDAMSLELPIVAARAGGMPELVSDAETGLLATARDAASIADAIERLMLDAALAARLAAAAKSRAAAFSETRMIDETLDVYEEVLAEKERDDAG